MLTRVLVHEWVTGGGLAGAPLPASWAREGQAMRRAIADDFHRAGGVEVVMTLDARLTEEGHPFRAVAVGEGEEVATLERLAAGSDFTVVIAPETGGVLEDRLARVERVGRSLGSAPAAVARTGHKLRLAGHLTSRGVRTPTTVRVRPGEGIPGGCAFPAVLKPEDGAGAVRTYLVDGPDDLARRLVGSDGMILQPYCRGEALSATFLVAPSGSLRLVAVGRQRVAVRDGVFSYDGGELPGPPGLARGAVCDALRAVPGLRGVVGVDFVRDGTTGDTTVIEINPRPTTSYVGLVRLLPPGALARAWLAAFRGEDGADDLRGMIPAGARPAVVFRPDGTLLDGENAGG